MFIERGKMKTFTLQIDDKCDKVLEELKVELSKTSKSEVLRLAIAMLHIVVKERKNGFRAILVKKDCPEKEFVF